MNPLFQSFPIDYSRQGFGTRLRAVASGLYVGSTDANVPNAAVIQLAEQNTRLAGAVLRRPINDGEPISPWLLDECVAFATQAPAAPVLVTCYAGLSRSASVAYALLRAAHGVRREEALRRVSGRTDDGQRWPHATVIASVQQWETLRGIR